MNVIVGSTNPIKIAAIREAFDAYHVSATIEGKSVPSEVATQPFSLDEIVRGAKNRALHAFTDCELGVGVESGIFLLAGKYFDTCHVALYDGATYYEGGAQYFEVPHRIVSAIKNEGKELGHFFEGQGQGAIGVLTQGRIDRQKQIHSAALLAIARLRNKEYA